MSHILQICALQEPHLEHVEGAIVQLVADICADASPQEESELHYISLKYAQTFLVGVFSPF